MVNHNIAVSDFKETSLQNVLEKVESYLQDRKQRQLLESEIRHMMLESEYIKDRTPLARKSIFEAIEAIDETEPRLAEQKQKHSSIKKKRADLEHENTAFETKLEDLKNKRSVLPGLRAQFGYLLEEVNTSSRSLKALQIRHQKALTEKENLEKEKEPLRTKLTLLEKEIPIIKNTRDILAGCMPEGFDADVYSSIQGKEEFERRVSDYVAEVRGEIEKVNKEAAELHTQLEEKNKEKEQLMSRKEHLQQKHEALIAEVGEEVSKSIIEEEISGLDEKKQHFVSESDRMTKELSQLESEIKRISDALELEKKVKADSMERHAYLSSRKQKMEELDSLEAEIERLKNETEKHKKDSEVNNNLTGTANYIKKDVDSINSQLLSAIEHYTKKFSEFDQMITELLS